MPWEQDHPRRDHSHQNRNVLAQHKYDQSESLSIAVSHCVKLSHQFICICVKCAYFYIEKKNKKTNSYLLYSTFKISNEIDQRNK